MKCQILFSGESKKNINLLSAELAQRVVRVKILFTAAADNSTILVFFFFNFSEKIRQHFI